MSRPGGPSAWTFSVSVSTTGPWPSSRRPATSGTGPSKSGATWATPTPPSATTRTPAPCSSPWRPSFPPMSASAGGSISSRQNEILARQGPNVGAYMAVGEIRYKSGNYDDAIAEFNEALALAPRDPAIWKRIGQTALRRRARQEDLWAKDFWQKGEFEDALSRWKTALEDCRLIEDMDGLKTILRGAGAIMYGSGSYDDAIDAYERDPGGRSRGRRLAFRDRPLPPGQEGLRQGRRVGREGAGQGSQERLGLRHPRRDPRQRRTDRRSHPELPEVRGHRSVLSRPPLQPRPAQRAPGRLRQSGRLLPESSRSRRRI